MLNKSLVAVGGTLLLAACSTTPAKAGVTVDTVADSRYVMSLDVVQFDCNQFVSREAHAHIDVVPRERATGAEAFRKTASVDLVVGSLVTMDAGIFAEVEDLRKVANDALQQAVDMALDDPAFVRLVR